MTYFDSFESVRLESVEALGALVGDLALEVGLNHSLLSASLEEISEMCSGGLLTMTSL